MAYFLALQKQVRKMVERHNLFSRLSKPIVITSPVYVINLILVGLSFLFMFWKVA